MIKLLLLFNLISCNAFAFAFTLPSIFKEWYCVGFEKNIDRTKPYRFNIGELPMVTWFDNKNNTCSTINICKHMGATLSNGEISKNGNLICPHHKIQYNYNDKFGVTTIYQNKLWWSYDPSEILPPKIPLYNKNYETIYMEFDINSHVTDCLINFMDVNNYYNPIGHNLNLQPSNVNNYRFNFNNVGILFDYNMVTNLNKNIKLSENFIYYNYPSNVWFRSSVSYWGKNRLEYDNIFLNINLLPLTTNKTKWYITVTFNNLDKSSIKKDIIQESISKMLTKQFELLSNQSNNILLKQYMMTHRKKIINDNINQDFEYLLKRYKYPDIQLVLNLYNYHRMKSL
jgi:nitrite reductase/ring-hydroxylating ferredoxin subunit